MNEILTSKYARYYIAGLVLAIICAWFSTGFHQVDEHFQILEFCNYKLGNSKASALPWEFQQKMRASILPGIAYGIAKVMIFCKLYNPFILAFLLRLLAATASWFITCKFCLLLSSKFKTKIGEKLLILMSFFLWFIPYLNVRFTPENMSGIVLLYGVYSILSMDEKTTNTYIRYLVAGLFFGVSFFIRSQISFAIAGFLAWLLLINKTKWKYLFVLGISMVAAIGINIIIDYWFYGVWVFTPFNYYYANIILHKAAAYGVDPWWFYFSDFILKAVPPLSLLLLIMFFAGIFKNLKNPLVWILVPFTLVHCFIEHKELRFLFPVAFSFIYITSLGFDYFLTKNFYLKIHKYVYTISLVLCIPLLLYRVLAPANISVNYFKYLYYNMPSKNTILFSLHKDDASTLYNLPTGFYKNPDLKTASIDSIPQLKNYLLTAQPESALFLSKNSPGDADFNRAIKGYKTEMVYCFLPAWILKYDINGWEERTQIWRIYQFTKTE